MGASSKQPIAAIRIFPLGQGGRLRDITWACQKGGEMVITEFEIPLFCLSSWCFVGMGLRTWRTR